MASQLARLYLRGSLCNETIRTLTSEQKEEIEQIINSVVKDPLLQQCRHEFRNALRRTIKNEYHDLEAGEQDYRIAIMRAAVAAKHGWPGHEPAQEALTDPIQRKKWFQTWAFNYLRQILRENKIPSITITRKVNLSADYAALNTIHETINEIIQNEKDVNHRRFLRATWKQVAIEDTDHGFVIKFDHWAFPIQIISAIERLDSMYLTHGVSIQQTVEGIEIRRTKTEIPKIEIKQKENNNIQQISFDGEQEESARHDQLETQMVKKDYSNTVDEEDIIRKLKKSIPTAAQEVLDIYMEETRPEAFIEKYGNSTPKAVHVAEFLKRSPKEIKQLLKVIKIHCIALGIGKQ